MKAINIGRRSVARAPQVSRVAPPYWGVGLAGVARSPAELHRGRARRAARPDQGLRDLDRLQLPVRDRGGPGRQPLVHRVPARARSVRSTRRPTRSASSDPDRLPARRGSRSARTATSGSPSTARARSARSTRRPTPSPSSDLDRRQRPAGDHGRPGRQPLVHRGMARAGSVRSTRRPTRSPSSPPRPPPASRTGSRRAPTATSGSPRPRRARSGDQPDDPRDHRVPTPTASSDP